MYLPSITAVQEQQNGCLSFPFNPTTTPHNNHCVLSCLSLMQEFASLWAEYMSYKCRNVYSTAFIQLHCCKSVGGVSTDKHPEGTFQNAFFWPALWHSGPSLVLQQPFCSAYTWEDQSKQHSRQRLFLPLELMTVKTSTLPVLHLNTPQKQSGDRY